MHPAAAIGIPEAALSDQLRSQECGIHAEHPELRCDHELAVMSALSDKHIAPAAGKEQSGCDPHDPPVLVEIPRRRNGQHKCRQRKEQIGKDRARLFQQDENRAAEQHHARSQQLRPLTLPFCQHGDDQDGIHAEHPCQHERRDPAAAARFPVDRDAPAGNSGDRRDDPENPVPVAARP